MKSIIAAAIIGIAALATPATAQDDIDMCESAGYLSIPRPEFVNQLCQDPGSSLLITPVHRDRYLEAMMSIKSSDNGILVTVLHIDSSESGSIFVPNIGKVEEVRNIRLIFQYGQEVNDFISEYMRLRSL